MVTAFGWKLLHADQELADKRDSAAASRPGSAVDSFYPLTMPVTVGPGSISVAITLGSQRPMAADLAHLGNFALLAGAAVAGLVAIAATCYVCYRFGDRMAKALGQSGTNVVTRLSAFILLCIGIESCGAAISRSRDREVEPPTREREGAILARVGTLA